MEVSGQPHVPDAFTPETEPQLPPEIGLTVEHCRTPSSRGNYTVP